jgi:peptidoglycan/xylan/chitin deacetylase (PgdA/CDA1 family)
MTWGPDSARAAVSVTFDNLGEADERQRGVWPADEPLGNHPSVREALPRILSLLDELGVRATFFAEGVNAEIYPDALASIAERGHEIAYHGWCHELWGALGADEERALFERGVEAMRDQSLELRGFRPPGGALTEASPQLLRELGFEYASPAGQRAGVDDGLAYVPFRWKLVDAFFYMEPFEGLREAAGAGREPMSPADLRADVQRALADLRDSGGHMCLLFHPFLLLDDERFQTMGAILAELDDVWTAPAHEVAAWMLEHSENFGPADLTPLESQ